MYCPNCGQTNSIEQKFCRKCGLNLEGSATSLLDQRPDIGTAHDKRLERFGNIAFGGLALAGLAAVVGLIYTIVTKFILSGSGVVFGIIMSLLIIFAVLGLAYVGLNETRKGKRTRTAAAPAELGSNDTSKLLDPGEFTPASSVVEDTTKLLKAEVKRQ